MRVRVPTPLRSYTNGLTVVPHGRFLKIIDTDAIASNETPIYGAHEGAPNEDRFVTRMHRLGHISADDAAAVLGKFKSKEADITVYGPGNMMIITDTIVATTACTGASHSGNFPA